MSNPRAKSIVPMVAVIAALIVLAFGALVFPRPPADVSADEIIAKALRVNNQSPSAPNHHIDRCLREGCTPLIEGADTIDGRQAWAVRLKLPAGQKYPWLEVWIDKNTSTILAWKEWGKKPDGRVAVLAQFPKP